MSETSRSPSSRSRGRSSSTRDRRGEAARGGAELPTTVREAIASRIDILPSEERSVLLDASVIGKTFWRGVLHSISEAEAIDLALEALEARDLIRHEPRSQVEGDREF